MALAKPGIIAGQLAMLLALVPACCAAGSSNASIAHGSAQFADPQPVRIVGYSGDAMEPFISRDGKYLFFNNLNTAPTTRLYWAAKDDPMTFELRGEIGGVNSAQLDAVPSIDLNGIFYFISNRSYSSNLSTVYTGTFNAGNVSVIGPVAGVSAPTPGLVDFDAEISADGDTLYFTEGRFDAAGQVQSARIMVAGRGAVGFRRSPQSAAIMEKINTPTLNYAADTSGTGLELFFTRLDPGGPAIYAASRTAISIPFGTPSRIDAITGFAEAPSLSPDGKSLYYHLKVGGHFAIYRVTRSQDPRS